MNCIAAISANSEMKNTSGDNEIRTPIVWKLHMSKHNIKEKCGHADNTAHNEVLAGRLVQDDPQHDIPAAASHGETSVIDLV